MLLLFVVSSVLFFIAAILFAIFLILSIIGHIFQGIGLSQIAKRRGIENPWLAWIPLANNWIFGRLSDQYRLHTEGKSHERTIKLIRLTVLWPILGGIIFCLVTGFVFLITALDLSKTELIFDIGVIVLLPALLIMLTIAAAVIFIVYLVVLYQAYYDLFRSCNPCKSKLFFWTGLLLGPLIGIFVFVCRKSDLGMSLPEVTEESKETPVPALCEPTSESASAVAAEK